MVVFILSEFILDVVRVHVVNECSHRHTCSLSVAASDEVSDAMEVPTVILMCPSQTSRGR